MLIDGVEVPDDQRFEPAFGMHAPENVIARALRVANFSDALDQAREFGAVLFCEFLFRGSQAKNYLSSSA